MERLLNVSEAKYLHESQVVSRILSEEKRLRQAIQNVGHDSRSACFGTEGRVSVEQMEIAMQWQTWVAGAKRSLNEELVQVLVLKEPAMKNLQLAHGRHLAIMELVARERIEKEKKADRNFLASIMQQTK